MEDIFIIGFLLLIGFLAFYSGIKMLIIKSKYDSWHKTKGTIIEKYVEKKQLSNGSSRANHKMYITYQYVVKDETHLSTVVYAIELLKGEVAMLEKQATKEINTLPNEVIVFYNPENHNEAFLKPISGTLSMLVIILASAMIISGILLILNL